MIGRWIRSHVRRITKPIPGDKAILWKRRLSVAYGLLAWNAFGLVCYYIATGRSDWPLYYGLKTEEEAEVRPGVYYANLLGVKKTTIVRMQGLTKVDQLEYDVSTYVPPVKGSSKPTTNADS